MFDFRLWRRSFAAAWEMLSDFPQLPERETPFREPPPAAVLYWFPAIGALAGISLALLGAFAEGISNRIAGALIFGALSLAFSELKDSGRGTSMLCALLLARLDGEAFSDTLPRLRSERTDIYAPTAQMTMLLLRTARFALFCLLGYCGARFWLVGILIASFAVQGDLATCGGADGAPPLLAVTPRQRRSYRIFAAALLAVLMLPVFPLSAVAAGAVAWILADAYRRMMERECGGMDPDAITMAGLLTEWSALLIGILWAIRL